MGEGERRGGRVCDPADLRYDCYYSQGERNEGRRQQWTEKYEENDTTQVVPELRAQGSSKGVVLVVLVQQFSCTAQTVFY